MARGSRQDVRANHEWQSRLLAEFDALTARADEAGDPAYDAEMARLVTELDRCSAQTRELAQRSQRQLRVVTWLFYAAVAASIGLVGWVVLRLVALRH